MKHPLTASATSILAAVLAAVLLAAPASSRAETRKAAASNKQTKPAKTKSASRTAAPAPAKSGISRDPYLGAIVMDAVSGKILIEDNADIKGYPASMLKLMDLLLILERIGQGKLALADQVPVSAKASKTGGSQVWLAEKESFSVEDLLYALMIQSANDAAVALAEKVAGSTDAFVGLMNEKAQALGMSNTVFRSVHGLPPGAGQEPDVTTARDFVLLCRALLHQRDALRYTTARERVFRPNDPKRTVVMRTHNHLLGDVEGCDGLKTGFFNDAGFSIAATAARNGHRLVAVVMGSSDRKVRDQKTAELLAQGFALMPPPAPPAAVSGPNAAAPAKAAPKK